MAKNGPRLTHGPAHLKQQNKAEFMTWVSMFHRCYYRNQKGYASCGARGISVCDEWTVFAEFLRDVGKRPGDDFRLVRIDADKGYFPANVRWMSRADRMRGKRKPIITADELRELVHYEPKTGVFTWKVDRRMGKNGTGRIVAQAGKEIGDRTASHWYPQVNIQQNVYLLHRLAFLYMTGEWPKGQVDHKDGNRGNNAWDNLRDVPQRINAQNLRRARADNRLGVQGVSKTPSGKFAARVIADGTRHFLGVHDTPEQASLAYIEGKRRLHEGCTI